MQASEVQFNDVLSECAKVIRSHVGLISATILLITIGNVLLDLLPNKGTGSFSGIVVSIYVQYYFVEQLLPEYIAADGARKRKYGSLFASGFFGGLGIVLGAVLLILPGIFLMARWAISTPFVVAEGMNGIEALKASWRATAPSSWPLFFVFLTSCGGLVALFFGIGVATQIFDLAEGNVSLSFALNFLVSVWLVGGWLLGVAIYRCTRPALSGLIEVFS